MAHEFYTMEEARQKLGMDEAEIRNLVVEGKLREFRQQGKVLFRREDVDPLADSGSAGTEPGIELVLEPADGGSADRSGTPTDAMDLTGGGDLLSLAEDEEESKPAEQDAKKDDTVVTSIGVNVFEGEELELEADPGAKTVLSEDEARPFSDDSGGSGSGLLDLTRESDDTSLGAELLDEIYPAEGDALGDSTKAGLLQEMGDSGTATGSSLGVLAGSGTAPGAAGGSGSGTGTGQIGASALGATPTTGSGVGAALEKAVGAGQAAAASEKEAVTLDIARSLYVADPYGSMFTGVMLVTVAVLGLAGAICAAFLRGAWPTYLDWLGGNLMLFGGTALALTTIVLGVGFFVARPPAPTTPKPKKEKKPRARKEPEPNQAKEQKK